MAPSPLLKLLGSGSSQSPEQLRLLRSLGRRGYRVVRPLEHKKANTTLLLADLEWRNHNHDDDDDDDEEEDQPQPRPQQPLRVVIKSVGWTCPSQRQQAEVEVAAMQQACSMASSSSSSMSPPCPYLVSLVEAIHTSNGMLVVMPYVEGGDLCDRVVQSKTGLTEDEARWYMMHMVQGLLHLKRHNVAHGDVSLENVLLSPAASNAACHSHSPSHNSGVGMGVGLPIAQLIDLGSACITKGHYGPDGLVPAHDYRFRGKTAYIPPEVAFCEYTSPSIDPFAVDVWGLGLCLYAMLTARPLYERASQLAFSMLSEGRVRELLEVYRHNLGLSISPLAADLICAMLRPEPSERLVLEQIMSHPWLTSSAMPMAMSAGVGVGMDMDMGQDVDLCCC